jgi:hypothetical protein
MPDAGVDIVGSAVSVTRVVANSGPEFHRQRETWNQLASGTQFYE